MTKIEQMVRMVSGAVFAKVDYSVPVATLRKSAVDGSGAVCPLWNRKDDIRKEVTGMLIDLGVKYEQAIKNRLEKDGANPDNFKAEAMNGKQAHQDDHKCLCQNMDRSKTYLRYMPMPCSPAVRYMLDGKDVGSQLVGFLAVPKPSQKQFNAGLDEERTIAWNTLDIQNITSISLLGVVIS